MDKKIKEDLAYFIGVGEAALEAVGENTGGFQRLLEVDPEELSWGDVRPLFELLVKRSKTEEDIELGMFLFVAAFKLQQLAAEMRH